MGIATGFVNANLSMIANAIEVIKVVNF